APDRAVLEARQRRIGWTRCAAGAGSGLGNAGAEVVNAVQEPERPGHAVLGPLRLLLGRSDEERVEPDGVRAELLDQLVGRDGVSAGLRHLLDLPGRRVDARDHSLIEEALEWLLDVDQTHVFENPADEPRV